MILVMMSNNSVDDGDNNNIFYRPAWTIDDDKEMITTGN